jgi:hypothetical protein
VALFANPKRNVKPLVFDLTLRRFKGNGHDRWLVSSFLPAASPTGEEGPSTRLNARTGVVAQPEGSGMTHASAIWLLLPAGIFSVLLVLLAAMGVRSWRAARLYRIHVRQNQTSSSSPS